MERNSQGNENIYVSLFIEVQFMYHKSHLFKCTTQCLLAKVESWATITTSQFRTISTTTVKSLTPICSQSPLEDSFIVTSEEVG